MRVIFLSVLYVGGDFAIVPFSTMEACLAAETGLFTPAVVESQCVAAYLDGPYWATSSEHAPEQAPLPIPRP